MKKLLALACAVFLILLCTVPLMTAFAEMVADVPVTDVGNIGEPLTWQYLATIGGAAAFTLLVVQFFKVPLDMVWKIPTRVFAYIVALIVMLVSTAFTSGLTLQNALLVATNAFMAALSAYGMYEVTFAKTEKKI